MHRRSFLAILLPALGCALGAPRAGELLARAAQSHDITPALQAGAAHNAVFCFAALGDTGTGGEGQWAVAHRMAELHAAQPFDTVLLLGDNLYPDGDPAGFREKFERPYAELVCSLGAETPEGFEDEDARVYAAYYPNVEVAKGRRPTDFLDSVAVARYYVIHLFCELDEGGDLRGGEGQRLEARDFFEACREADVKLLFMAGENCNESYIQMGRRQPKGVALDVVRTIVRNGESFASFLGKLLGRMSTGKTLAEAWVEIAPQSESAQQGMQLPATYCSVGRAAVLLP